MNKSQIKSKSYSIFQTGPVPEVLKRLLKIFKSNNITNFNFHVGWNISKVLHPNIKSQAFILWIYILSHFPLFINHLLWIFASSEVIT